MRWLILCAVILNQGCFYGGPSVDRMVQEAVKAQPPVTIPAPAPLAKHIDLLIVDGELIRCNNGCATLLRAYDGTRQAILKAWPPK